MREDYHLIFRGEILARDKHINTSKSIKTYTKNKRAFNGIITRIKWRSHSFIQKFEVECEYEFRGNINI